MCKSKSYFEHNIVFTFSGLFSLVFLTSNRNLNNINLSLEDDCMSSKILVTFSFNEGHFS